MILDEQISVFEKYGADGLYKAYRPFEAHERRTKDAAYKSKKSNNIKKTYSTMKKIIASPYAPKAVGPYSQAIQCDNTLYASGQLPIDGATGTMPETIEEQTHQSLKNIGHILTEAGMSYDNVVKTTVLLDDIKDFAAMNAVYAEYFQGDKPARVCYEVAKLPMGAKVEIDCIAVK